VQHLSLKPPRTSASIPPKEKPTLPLPSIPSIAVMPFTNLSGDPQQEYFSDGITDDLVTDLSRVPGLFVIDRGSAFTYKGKPTKVTQVGQELGVKYVLEGSVRKAADRVRINVQLVDASTGNQVWTQRYDRQLRDIFMMQDEIVQSLVATLNLQITVLQRGYLIPQRTKSLEAYDYYLRAFEYVLTPSPDGFIKARKMAEKAIELDPLYADAYTLMGFFYFVGYVWQWEQDPGVLDRAAKLAEKAVALDDSNSTAYALLGYTDAYRRQRDRGVANGKRAVSVGPNDAFAWLALSEIMLLSGNPEGALAAAQKGMRLDPRHKELYFTHEGFSYIGLGRFEQAVAALKAGDQANPYTHAELAHAYAELGRAQDARAEGAEVMRISPHFSLKEWQRRVPRNWNDPANQELLAELRKAGLN
jgi:adenylate cyclase